MRKATPTLRPHQPTPEFSRMWKKLLHASQPPEKRGMAIVLYDPALARRQAELAAAVAHLEDTEFKRRLRLVLERVTATTKGRTS